MGVFIRDNINLGSGRVKECLDFLMEARMKASLTLVNLKEKAF